MAKLVAKFRFHTVSNNTRRASLTYEGKYRRMIIRQAAATKTHVQKQIQWKRSGYPKNHTGAYKNNIRFAWDAGSKTAIAGPTRLKHFNVPRALEFGGTSRWMRRNRYGFHKSGLQKVRRYAPMRRALNSPYVQAQMAIIAREELT